ncbi:hypothetical protein GCM10027217_00730 [Pseudomaricurvus hydrocarbonicus]
MDLSKLSRMSPLLEVGKSRLTLEDIFPNINIVFLSKCRKVLIFGDFMKNIGEIYEIFFSDWRWVG